MITIMMASQDYPTNTINTLHEKYPDYKDNLSLCYLALAFVIMLTFS